MAKKLKKINPKIKEYSIFKMFIFYIIICFCFFSQMNAQHYKILSKSDKIANNIDRQCKSIDSCRICQENIKEGESLDGKNVFEIYSLKSSDSKNLYRVIHNYTVDSIYTSATFYYYQNKIARIRIKKSKIGVDENISYYFFNNKLIKFIGKKEHKFQYELYRKEAERYCLEYIKM